jgi:hypothetical protein
VEELEDTKEHRKERSDIKAEWGEKRKGKGGVDRRKESLCI